MKKTQVTTKEQIKLNKLVSTKDVLYLKIGANKAYFLYNRGYKIKRGKDSQYLPLKVEDLHPRSFFRQYKDWYSVRDNVIF